MGGIQDGDSSADCQLPITFRVSGMNPAPQGSKSFIGKGIGIESCKNLKPWRNLVACAAVDHGVPLIRGPVRLSIVFLFTRPAGHFRKDGTLKPSAPKHHCVKPDVSKVLRSTEDALSKLAYEDDARIVGYSGLDKRYCVGDEKPGAIIAIIPLSP
jgi:Holliday junction resolvase RusA-like endonuclease